MLLGRQLAALKLEEVNHVKGEAREGGSKEQRAQHATHGEGGGDPHEPSATLPLLTAPPFYDMVALESNRLEKFTIAIMCYMNSFCPQRCKPHRAGINHIHAARLARPLRVRRK